MRQRMAVLVGLGAWVAAGVAQAQTLGPTRAAMQVAVIAISEQYPHGESQITKAVSAEARLPVGGRFNVRLGVEVQGWQPYLDGTSTFDQRVTIVSALVDRRLIGGRRVALEGLVGLSYVNVSARALRPVPRLRQAPADSWPAPTVGLAVPVALTPHVSLVADVRYHSGVIGTFQDFYGYSRGLVRPRVGVRWSF